jgi:hypothetical protein
LLRNPAHIVQVLDHTLRLRVPKLTSGIHGTTSHVLWQPHQKSQLQLLLQFMQIYVNANIGTHVTSIWRDTLLSAKSHPIIPRDIVILPGVLWNT